MRVREREGEGAETVAEGGRQWAREGVREREGDSG